MNGHANIDPNIFFKIKTGKITRRHDVTLVKGLSRPTLDFTKYYFYQRTVNDWNQVSADYGQSRSVNMLKNKTGNYLVRWETVLSTGWSSGRSEMVLVDEDVSSWISVLSGHYFRKDVGMLEKNTESN